uniref:Inositol-1-monophosphatase n=1 Tax=Ciona savignyi TaxID=51511 RepID=H2ZKT7_CIOSA
MAEVNDIDLKEILDFGVNLSRTVGSVILKAFKQPKKIQLKETCADLVTETDQLVEHMIIKAIKDTYPTHKFIGEESVAAGLKCNLTDEPTWIVDPIDGTTNFVHRYPYVAVCLGFCMNKTVKVGIVYNVPNDEMFTAIRGLGAFCNGKQLQVSDETDLAKSLLMAEFGSKRDPETIEKVLKNITSVLTNPVHAIHNMGSAALNICAVASAQAEAYYEYGIHCWDYCAASIILEEAGGVIIDTEGGPMDLMARRLVAACNTSIAQSLSRKLITIEYPRD